MGLDARSRGTGPGGESLRQIANRRDFYCENVALVEHRLLRHMPSEAHHQVAMREVIEDSMDHGGVAGDLGLGDECGPGSRADPSDHRTAAPYAFGFPSVGTRLNVDQAVGRESEPDRRRLALVAVFADGRDIDDAGLGKCVEIALGSLAERRALHYEDLQYDGQ